MNRRNLIFDLFIAAVLVLVAAGLLLLRERIAYKSALMHPNVRQEARMQQPPSDLIGRWELSSDNVTFFYTLEMRPDGIYRFIDRRGNIVRAGKYFVKAEDWVIFKADETLAEEGIAADIIYNHELEYVITSSPRQLALFYSGISQHGDQIQVVWKFISKNIVAAK